MREGGKKEENRQRQEGKNHIKNLERENPNNIDEQRRDLRRKERECTH